MMHLDVVLILIIEEEGTSLIFTSPLMASLEYPAELRALFRCFKFLIFPVTLVVKIVHSI